MLSLTSRIIQNKYKIRHKNICKLCIWYRSSIQKVLKNSHRIYKEQNRKDPISKMDKGEFPGGQVFRTPCFHYRGPAFNPWSMKRSNKPLGAGKGKKMDEGFEYTVLQKRYTNGQQALVIREMQIKTTVKYHFTPTRVSIKNKTEQKHQKIASVGEDVEKLEPSYTTRGLVGLLDTELPYDSEILLLSISQRIENRYLHKYFV